MLGVRKNRNLTMNVLKSVLELEPLKVSSSNTDEKVEVISSRWRMWCRQAASDIYEDAALADLTSSILVMIRKLTCDAQGR